MTGVDCPGKSATQSASLTAIRSGKFFSSDVPFCWGPRQSSQPWTGSAPAVITLTHPPANNPLTQPKAVVLFIILTSHHQAVPCRRVDQVARNIQQVVYDCNQILLTRIIWLFMNHC